MTDMYELLGVKKTATVKKIDAARAYNEAAKKYFGVFALLNVVD